MLSIRSTLMMLCTFVSLALPAPAASAASPEVPAWHRFETAFEGTNEYGNPVQDLELKVRFVSPSGKEQTVLGFWDGGRTWRVRFMPGETGEWSWETTAGDGSDKGLHGRSGTFRCTAYAGDNPLYANGRLRLSGDRRNLMHADGRPFFWLADTAWNGGLKATEADWKTYLADRRGKKFTGIQFVISQWRAGPTDGDGQVAFTGHDEIEVNPAFFQRMDKYFDLCNESELVALPVLLWAIKGDINPGWNLPADQCVVLVRYMVARYGAHHSIWIVGGDGNYRGEASARWNEIGREGLKYNPGHLATLHPQGMNWPWPEFKDADWLDIETYQSGHGDNENTLKWLVAGPPATQWNEEPIRPVINAEPNYEDHLAYHSREPHSAFHVRRAAYWSLLVSPPAGVTYGAHGVWSWETERAEPLAHRGTGEAKPWSEAMTLPGSAQMKILRDLFDRLPWWDLRPAPDLVLHRPEGEAWSQYIALAKTPDNEWGVAYLPDNDGVALNAKAFGGALEGVWFDPRTGKFSKTVEVPPDKPDIFLPAPPGESDWVLVLHKKQ